VPAYQRYRESGEMRIAIFTLFPQMFAGPFDASIVARARAAGLLSIELHNFRDFARDRHRSVDDYPYGGGAGMVCRCEPLFAAVEAAQLPEAAPIVLLTPQGRRFTQRVAERLAGAPALALICGHYEGVDERVCAHLATEEVSIGDYVLSGGEPAAMVIVDAITRLLPGAIGAASITEESHQDGLLEYPQYTRPAEFRGWQVPEVLLGGNHAAIAAWRRGQALRRTWLRRPDLLATAHLSAQERAMIDRWTTEQTVPDSSAVIPNPGDNPPPSWG
jgi:tRNA (guanine37-N1)-methyltransferase